MSEFEIKENNTISSVWLTSFKCCIRGWKSLKLINFIMLLLLHWFLFLSIVSVLLKSFNNYFFYMSFTCFLLHACLQVPSMLMIYTMWSSNIFPASSCFLRFSSSRFLGSRFFRIQVFQGPNFYGLRFFGVQVQVPGPESRFRF